MAKRAKLKSKKINNQSIFIRIEEQKSICERAETCKKKAYN